MDVGKSDKRSLNEQQSIISITMMKIILTYIYHMKIRELGFLDDKELNLSQSEG